jgi:PAS domain-containing protein
MSTPVPNELANLERKRAEQARQDRDADSETLANLVPQLVWMCNPDGLNMYFNQRWCSKPV